MSKTIKIIFAISLIANIFLLGIVTGRSFSKLHYHPHKGFCHKKIIERFSPQSKDLFEKQIKTFRHNDQEFFMQVKKARADVLQVLTAKEFDRQLYREKLETLRALHRSRMEAFAGSIEDMASQMPQKDRIILAQALEKFAYEHHIRHK